MSEGGKVQGLRAVGPETVVLSWCFGRERPGPAPETLSGTAFPVDLVLQPKNWDCGTWVVMGVMVSAGGSWSELRAGHSPAERELLVVAAAAAAGKESPGLAPVAPVLSPAALHSWPEGHPETCHTAFESVTEKAAAVNSPKPAAVEAAVAVVVVAEFAVFGCVVGAVCVAAAVWPSSCPSEVVSCSTLWL